MTLLLAVFAVFSQVGQFAFVDYDDPDYSGNPHIGDTITPESLAWAFTSGDPYWIPLTRLTYMLDRLFFGADSGWYHRTNVLFHALATLLLFAFLERSTGARWRSLLVAALFALHPLHVESVAWVSERKDVLSACCWFLALYAYVRYAEQPSLRCYLPVLAAFSLGLMAKPMTVTLPFVLLLVDFWPLERLRLLRAPAAGGQPRFAPVAWKQALLEKVPFLALAIVGGIITYLFQLKAGAVENLAFHSLGLRIENSLVSYATYIGKVFWPSGLAVLYPYPSSIPLWQAVAAFVVLAGISVLALRFFRTGPYLLIGWLWYLGTLVPVIGIVQVGLQARADRYMYIPMVGLSLMLAWGAADAVRRWPQTRRAVVWTLAAGCIVAAFATWVQLQYWKDSETLFQRAVAVTEANYIMHYDLGLVYTKAGRLPDAIAQYENALRIEPSYVAAHTNLAKMLMEVPGRLPDAIAHCEAAVRIRPDAAETHNYLGAALSRVPGRETDAIAQYQEALRIKPEYAEAHSNLATALVQIPERMPEAISHWEASLRLNPDSAEAHQNLASALSQLPDRLQDAIMHYEAALRLKPDYVEAHYNLALSLSRIPSRWPEAMAHLEAVQRLRPSPEVRQMLDRLRAGPGAN